MAAPKKPEQKKVEEKPVVAAAPQQVEVVVPVEVVPFNTNKSPTARNVLHVRCGATTQIGAFGSSLDAVKHKMEMELRPDLGGVLVSVNLGGKDKEYLIPFGSIAHIELEPEDGAR
jgi:hypothetical protein